MSKKYSNLGYFPNYKKPENFIKNGMYGKIEYCNFQTSVQIIDIKDYVNKTNINKKELLKCLLTIQKKSKLVYLMINKIVMCPTNYIIFTQYYDKNIKLCCLIINQGNLGKNTPSVVLRTLLFQYASALKFLHNNSICLLQLRPHFIDIYNLQLENIFKMNQPKPILMIKDLSMCVKYDRNMRKNNLLSFKPERSIFLAPELHNNNYFCPKSDIWSFGIIYSLLLNFHIPMYVTNVTKSNELTNSCCKTKDSDLITNTNQSIHQQISKSQKHLLRKTFQLNYYLRCNAEQILDNDWLNNREKPLIRSITVDPKSSIIKKVSCYLSKNKREILVLKHKKKFKLGIKLAVDAKMNVFIIKIKPDSFTSKFPGFHIGDRLFSVNDLKIEDIIHEMNKMYIDTEVEDKNCIMTFKMNQVLKRVKDYIKSLCGAIHFFIDDFSKDCISFKDLQNFVDMDDFNDFDLIERIKETANVYYKCRKVFTQKDRNNKKLKLLTGNILRIGFYNSDKYLKRSKLTKFDHLFQIITEYIYEIIPIVHCNFPFKHIIPTYSYMYYMNSKLHQDYHKIGFFEPKIKKDLGNKKTRMAVGNLNTEYLSLPKNVLFKHLKKIKLVSNFKYKCICIVGIKKKHSKNLVNNIVNQNKKKIGFASCICCKKVLSMKKPVCLNTKYISKDKFTDYVENDQYFDYDLLKNGIIHIKTYQSLFNDIQNDLIPIMVIKPKVLKKLYNSTFKPLTILVKNSNKKYKKKLFEILERFGNYIDFIYDIPSSYDEYETAETLMDFISSNKDSFVPVSWINKK